MKRIVEEIEHLGINEFFLHIMARTLKIESAITKMYIQREKYYEKLSNEQLEQELNSIYKRIMKYDICYDNPRSFTEYIQYVKLHDADNIKTILADKLLVRDWIRNKIGEKYLIPLLGVWDNVSEINFKELPNQFCLKVNHGSGMNYVVKNKEQMNKRTINRLFKAWMQRPFEAVALERHYKNINRKIIAEQYIEGLEGSLYDYKIHCFNGKPVFIQCIGNRNLKLHTGEQGIYDLEWNKLEWTFETYPAFNQEVSKPQRLKEMLEIATKLASGFKYVRVDLYDLEDKVLFGEMTFTPGAGFYPYLGTWTREKDLELGNLINGI